MEFNAENVEMEINGIPIEYLSDDADCIAFPNAQKQTEERLGFTGDEVYFGSPERRGGMVTIKLLPNSPSLAPLMRLAAAWRRGEAIVWEGNISDLNTGASATMSGGALMQAPRFFTYGKETVGNMEFQWKFQDIVDSFDGVTLPQGR